MSTIIELPDIYSGDTSELSCVDTPVANVVAELFAKLEKNQVARECPPKQQINQEMMTGSLLQGALDVENMSGEVQYTMPHGVIFTGSMRNGMFQGDGVLCYPTGAELYGTWDQGQLVNASRYVYKDGLARPLHMDDLEKDFNYCSGEDRRFYDEILGGMAPGTDRALPPVPEKYYELEDGNLDLSLNWVLLRDSLQPLRHASAWDISRAVKYFRRGWDEYSTSNERWSKNDRTVWNTGTARNGDEDQRIVADTVINHEQNETETFNADQESDKGSSSSKTKVGRKSFETADGLLKQTIDGKPPLETTEKELLIDTTRAYELVPGLAELKRQYRRERTINILEYKVNHGIATEDELVLHEKLKLAGATLHNGVNGSAGTTRVSWTSGETLNAVSSTVRESFGSTETF